MFCLLLHIQQGDQQPDVCELQLFYQEREWSSLIQNTHKIVLWRYFLNQLLRVLFITNKYDIGPNWSHIPFVSQTVNIFSFHFRQKCIQWSHGAKYMSCLLIHTPWPTKQYAVYLQIFHMLSQCLFSGLLNTLWAEGWWCLSRFNYFKKSKEVSCNKTGMDFVTLRREHEQFWRVMFVEKNCIMKDFALHKHDSLPKVISVVCLLFFICHVMSCIHVYSGLIDD